MSDHPVFDGSNSDLIVMAVLSDTIVGFFDKLEGYVEAVTIEHEEAFLVSEIRVDEAAGARVVVDVSRTTETEVTLICERLAGEETGDLELVGERRGLLA